MRLFLSTLLLALGTGAAQAGAPQPPVISGAALLEQITALASDELEGRAPGTHGETLTIDYLQQQFKKLGLEPGNPDGTYLQAVPLVGVSSHPALSYSKDGKATSLKFGEDYVSWTAQALPTVDVSNSELVFVGYGVQAPQFQWDDYKGADLKGKTLVMLINDPPVPDPKHARQLDPRVFGGSAMTWYGHWQYKFAMAAQMGAAAALLVHETQPAGYPWDVVVSSWGRENFALKSSKPAPDLPSVPGWLRGARAQELFKAAGLDFDALKQQAATRAFKPVPLGIKLNVTTLNAVRELSSHNVVGKISGSDPQLKNEVVIYSAHWDHFGIDETLPGPRTQQIFHGALDNASGVAALLQIARAYKALPAAPKRTIVFVLTTAEERGMLGAQYYARHPLYPLDKTLLDINVDGLNMWGRARTVALSGVGRSTADALVMAAAAKQGRKVNSAEPGSYYRGDQIEFAKAGVPTIYLRNSGHKDQQLRYMTQQFHTVNDTVQPGWDTSGAVEDIELLFQAGYAAAQGKDAPKWKDGAEFQRR